MLDFNTKKKILRKLSDCAEKHFIMLIPCLIAAGFVKLFYFIVCNIDIALSDKEGNFLGIKHRSGEKVPKKKKDDIVYVKRSFWSRAVSCVLVFAFVGMFVPVAMPAIGASAATSVTDYISTQDADNPLNIDYSSDYDKYVFCYDSTTAIPNSNPNITECKSANGAVLLRWDQYNIQSMPKDNTGTDINKRNGTFNSAKIFCNKYNKDGALVEQDISLGSVYLKSSSGTQSVASGLDLSKVTENVITGLDTGYNYEFYMVVYENIVIYQLQEGDTLADLADYTYESNGSVIINTDKTSTRTAKVAKSAKVVQHKIVSNTIMGYPGSMLPEPNPNADVLSDTQLAVTYNDDGYNEVAVSTDLLNKTGVTGYYIYKSSDTVDGNGKHTLSNYTQVCDIVLNTIDCSNVYRWRDYNISPTSKYSYIICAYQVAFQDKTGKNCYLTSSLPTGTAGNGYDEHVYTKTEAPTSVNVVNNNSYFTITWPSVVGATSYIVERDDNNGNIVVVDSHVAFEAGKTSYSIDDKNVESNKNYTYRVYAVNGNNNGRTGVDGSPKSDAAINKDNILSPNIYTPFDIKVTSSNNDTSVNITWKCYGEDITGFDIEVKHVEYDAQGNEIEPVDENGNPVIYKPINDIKASYALVSTSKDDNGKTVYNYSYTDSGYVYGESYRFKVRSYIIVGETNNKEPKSDYVPQPLGYKVTIGTKILPPQEISAVSGDKQITVNWSASEGADYYILSIEKKSGSRFTVLSTKIVNGTSYVHTGLKDGDTYWYRVKAVKKVLGVDTESDFTNYVAATVCNPLTKPVDLKITQNGDNLVITWKKVDGADGYYLIIKGDGFTDIKDVTEPTYTQTDAKYGVTYEYVVYAYKTITYTDGSRPDECVSEPSNKEWFTLGGSISFPTDLKAVPYDGRIELSWNVVPGAAGYVLYATCDGRTETFNVSGTSFSHTGLTPGKTYTYYVVAYKFVNDTAVYSIPSNTVTATVGSPIGAPTDFSVTPAESSATLKWTAPKGSKPEGYTVYGTSDSGQRLEIDVSKTTYTHTGLMSGDIWTYYVKAYKTINNQRVYSDPTTSITVKIGTVLAAPTDLVAASGNRQVALKWTKVKNADGYIVYVYDEATANFQPISIVSKPTYTHTGLKNGTKYTYMVAAYKMISGERVIGDYSLSVSAIPTAGNAADVDFTINVKGTVPYGISHSELISAAANHDAFNDPVDAYFSVNDESTRAIKEVLRGYANGLKSFIIYPFDISLYLENTLVEVEPNEGFNVTFTIPVPDQMIGYRDYITVVHLKTDGTDTVYDDSSDDIFISSTELEVLPSAIIDVNGVWCVQFTTASCSPFAFVIYKDNLDDVSSGGASSAGGTSAGSFNTGVLLFTALPDIMPSEKKTKYVVATKKRYRIKK